MDALHERYGYIKDMFDSGMTLDDIANETGLNKRNLGSVLKRFNVSAIDNDERYARMIELKKSGMTVLEISKEVGLSQATVSQHLCRNGFRSRVGKRKADESEAEIIPELEDIEKLPHARPRMNRIEIANGKKWVDVTETIFNQPSIGKEELLCMMN